MLKYKEKNFPTIANFFYLHFCKNDNDILKAYFISFDVS